MKTERCTTIAQFRGKIIMHARLNEVVKEIRTVCRDLAEAGENQKIIVVCGPAGAGKTTAQKIEEKLILKNAAAEMAKDPAYFPAVEVCVDKAAEARSVWKQFWQDLLGGFSDVLIENKSLPQARAKGLRQVSGRESTEALRLAVRNQVMHRRTGYLFVDEAQHLLTKGQGRTEKDNLDVLKSLVAKFRVLCILAGPYELKTLVALDGQLIRRVRFIHFSAYGQGKKDHKDFYDTVRQMEALLPLPFADDVKVETLFEGTLGCVGLLKDWMVLAAQRAINSSAKKIHQADFLQTMLSGEDLTTLATEIAMGEAAFSERNGVRKNIREFLGLPEEPEAKAPAKPRKFSPGIRHPRRDPLG